MDSMTTTPIQRLAADWPGKSARQEPADTHPALWHMLDVAACAELLMKRHVHMSTWDANMLSALLILIALHDIGKISESFRRRICGDANVVIHHADLGYYMLRKMDGSIGERLGGSKYGRKELYASVAGHHGSPPKPSMMHDTYNKWERAIGESGFADAEEILQVLCDLFPGASLGNLNEQQGKCLSWLLSGLTVAADWVGSNEAWFPFEKIEFTLEEYWRKARAKAKIAVIGAGLVTGRHTQATSGIDLVRQPRLRPMQSAAEQCDIPKGCSMFMLEDATGSGKTEAAMILAHRLIAERKARGIFFALPTMATANAMFERLQGIIKQLYSDDASLSLAHGKSKLYKGFRSIEGKSHDESPESDCSAWLADESRKGFLADVSVGTIDQALMGILPTRYSTLRLFGLSDLVLVVDEAHAYDPYMEKELNTLLRFHAMFGGCAVVMTATLPLRLRESYVKSYREGLGFPPQEASDNEAYPSISVVNEKCVMQPVDPLPAACRNVAVIRMDTTEEALSGILAAADMGCACAWIRNSVDEAIAAVHKLKERGHGADLLHARYAMCDRMNHEGRVVAKYGKTGEGRQGSILVATQVVEASLDLDFDYMVSDLAPIGSLIQRSGRLWRHMDIRPSAERPTSNLVLHVLSPDPEKIENDMWLRAALGRGAWVYDLDSQWLTAKAIFEAGCIDAPKGLRRLIESVHSREARNAVPEALSHATDKAEGRRSAEYAMAKNNVAKPNGGYFDLGKVYGDKLFPTRLGEPQQTLALAKQENDVLVPWGLVDAAGDMNIGWSLSEVNMARHRLNAKGCDLDQEKNEIEQAKSSWQNWRKDAMKVAVVADDGRINRMLTYTSAYGLQLQQVE